MSTNEHRLAFWALSSAFVVDLLGYAFIVPILPSWKEQFGLSNGMATALVSLWAVPLFLLGPYAGRITDKFGPGKTIIASLVLLTGASLLYLLATEELLPHPFWVLVVARLVHGASGAAIITAGFAAASKLWPLNFGEQSGKLLAIGTIGGLLGPVIGGLAFEFGQSLAFILLAMITAAAIPLALVSESKIGKSDESAQGGVSIKVFLQNPMLLRIGLLIMLATLATGALEAGVPLFLAEEPLSMGAGQIGGVLLLMVLMQGLGGWWWGTLVDRRGPTRYMIIGWILVISALIASGVIAHYWLSMNGIIVIIALLGIFQFAVAAAQVPMLPMIDTATSQAYGEGSTGLAFGAFGTAWAAGTIFGPLLIGIILDISGEWGITLGMVAIPMILGLILTLVNRNELSECYEQEMAARKK